LKKYKFLVPLVISFILRDVRQV